MNRETEFARVAIVVIEQFPSSPNMDVAEILTDFCEKEDMIPIVLLREETSEGVIGYRGYQAISELLDKKLIDGVITISDEVLDGEFGDKLVMDSNMKDFFVLSYEQEMAIRKAEEMKQAEDFAGHCNQGVDILSLLMM